MYNEVDRYRRIIMVLSIWALMLCGMKIYQVNDEVIGVNDEVIGVNDEVIGVNDEVIEVNYIGDMEQENKEYADNSENLNSEVDDGESKDIMTEESYENIRVILTTTGFQSNIHETVSVSAPSGLIVTYICDGEEIKEEMETFSIEDIGEWNSDGSISVEMINSEERITIESIERAYGCPTYYGELELFIEKTGIVIVNELPLELYLRGVLPSEMPASYNVEALKAQAVCARSYAYTHMSGYNFPEYMAHVDDSTAYQVYNNCEETEATNQAIADTEYEKVTYEGAVVMTYFFSTSSGYTTDIAAWGEEAEAYEYLTGVRVWDGSIAYESGLSWYKWSVFLTKEELVEILEYNIKEDVGELTTIEVTKYGTGGVALELKIVGTEMETTITTEYSIRNVLGSSMYSILRQDGTTVQGSALLPSAFFEIIEVDNGYEIQGGGYGHGVGMSQNGANEMAKAGLTYVEILEFFYTGIEVSI